MHPDLAIHPDAWKQIAHEDPNGFSQVQSDFIKQTHYDPVVDRVFARTGVDINDRSDALQDVVWSTSVQHGTAAKLIINAIGQAGGADSSDEAIIDQIYQDRTTLVQTLYDHNKINFNIFTSLTTIRYPQENVAAIKILNQRR